MYLLSSSSMNDNIIVVHDDHKYIDLSTNLSFLGMHLSAWGPKTTSMIVRYHVFIGCLFYIFYYHVIYISLYINVDNGWVMHGSTRGGVLHAFYYTYDIDFL